MDIYNNGVYFYQMVRQFHKKLTMKLKKYTGPALRSTDYNPSLTLSSTHKKISTSSYLAGWSSRIRETFQTFLVLLGQA